jgi:hypothetical protein
MSSPRVVEYFGSAIHPRMDGGIQAGSGGRTKFSDSLSRNRLNFPLDSSSARMGPSSDLRVIFWMSTVDPSAAATRPMAATSVVDRLHVEL